MVALVDLAGWAEARTSLPALRSDLDAPAALAAVDRWAEASLAGGGDADATAQVRAAVDALLGIAL